MRTFTTNYFVHACSFPSIKGTKHIAYECRWEFPYQALPYGKFINLNMQFLLCFLTKIKTWLSFTKMRHARCILNYGLITWTQDIKHWPQLLEIASKKYVDIKEGINWFPRHHLFITFSWGNKWATDKLFRAYIMNEIFFHTHSLWMGISDEVIRIHNWIWVNGEFQ